MTYFDSLEWEINGEGIAGHAKDSLLSEARRGGGLRGGDSPKIAVRLLELIVHDNQRLFGEASIRIDALVIHGQRAGASSTDIYAPRTFRFDRVKDGESLPIGQEGLLIFFGKPRYFLDLFITVSRDREGSSSLHSILGDLAQSDEGMSASGQLLAMASGAPDADLLGESLKAALLIGDAALANLKKETNGTIGLYRNSWLRGKDEWGIGQHPEVGLLRAKDISFRFEIIKE
ncbi:hypothetical protein [Kitasatospora sp. NPDC093679]|uniref:hypothetical protein n=1 Tax=Kitasatospora sp. NPDC093679 TaxID=3154983 RepID=UPI003417D165